MHGFFLSGLTNLHYDIYMRVDKYLKVSRILKRRTLSKELVDNDRILVNGKVAKPSKEVNPGDTITVLYGNRFMTVKVNAIANQIKKNEANAMYEVIEEGIRNA